LPASALKGALRTALAYTRWNPGVIGELAKRAETERGLRRPGEAAEAMTLGSSSNDPMRTVMAGDSAPVDAGLFRIYLVRVASLTEKLNWKPNPVFAEMAPARTAFQGGWKVTSKEPKRLFQAANEHAAKLLEMHREYANRAGLPRVGASLDALGSLLDELRERRDACMVNLGWAGGFLSKSGFLDTANEDYRKLLRASPSYERAIRTGLPFPKTRRIVYEKGEPSALPGWAMLEVL
jgi:CRISPR-associated protein Csm5